MIDMRRSRSPSPGNRSRTIRNQHPDTVVLTFLGPAEAGRVDLVGQAGTRTLVQPVPAIPRAVVGVMVTDEAAAGGEAPSGPVVLSSIRAAQTAASEAQP